MHKVKNILSIVACLGLLLSMSSLVAAAETQGVVNVNQADAAQLQLLPRVGPAVAQRILDFRDEHGAFKSKEDLMLVRGIGERTFERLAPYVTLEGQTTLTEKVSLPRTSASEDGAEANA